MKKKKRPGTSGIPAGKDQENNSNQLPPNSGQDSTPKPGEPQPGKPQEKPEQPPKLNKQRKKGATSLRSTSACSMNTPNHSGASATPQSTKRPRPSTSGSATRATPGCLPGTASRREAGAMSAASGSPASPGANTPSRT